MCRANHGLSFADYLGQTCATDDGTAYTSTAYAGLSCVVNAAKEIRLSTQLQRATVPRYSNRQQQAMNLEGLMGTVTLHGELGDFAPLLQGEYIHVGKSATFGLGRYSILTGE